jgi:hypothetical protein
MTKRSKKDQKMAKSFYFWQTLLNKRPNGNHVSEALLTHDKKYWLIIIKNHLFYPLVSVLTYQCKILKLQSSVENPPVGTNYSYFKQ